MEAEMDRFEQEILTPHSASDLPRVIIGSSTYNQVSAQLKKLREATGSNLSTNEERESRAREVAAQLKLLRAQTENAVEQAEDLLKPPPPPPPVSKSEIPFLPPPPPPPPILSGQPATPSFIPPQLRHRAPPPPPRMRPPVRPPFGGMGPGPAPGGGPHGPMGPGPGPMGPGPGGPPMGPGPMGPGPGPFPGPPRPGFGPMGPGGPRGPMRPPMHPMGPGPGPDYPMGPMPFPGGPQEPSGGGMYGVSSGEAHKNVEEGKEKSKEPEDDKPKTVYASAPQIVVPIEKKERKRKRKKKEKGEDNNSNSTDTTKVVETDSNAPSAPESLIETTAAIKPEHQEDFQVADMEIDTSVAPMARKEKKEKKKKFIRFAAGQAWEDQTLAEWDQDDFRLFCGDLGNEVTDETLSRAFSKYPTFVKAKVVRDKRTQKTKGYGFVSFKDPNDYVRAIREMNGKYVGNRPIKLRKSTWRDRNIDIVKKKEKEKKRLGLK